MNTRHDPALPWNQNIVRNLRQKYGEDLALVSDTCLLKRYDEWSMMGLGDGEADMLEYLQTGE